MHLTREIALKILHGYIDMWGLREEKEALKYIESQLVNDDFDAECKKIGKLPYQLIPQNHEYGIALGEKFENLSTPISDEAIKNLKRISNYLEIAPSE
jgi:hypothetical protein